MNKKSKDLRAQAFWQLRGAAQKVTETLDAARLIATDPIAKTDKERLTLACSRIDIALRDALALAVALNSLREGLIRAAAASDTN